MKSVRGKRALITGAASGIGREIALQLALEGAHVYLLDVDAEKLAEVVRDAQVCGVEAVGAKCDLTQPADIAAALSQMQAAWGPLDILVNNAGVVFYGPTEKMTAAQWDWLLGINLLAPIQITRELLPTLLSRPEAHILNVCSIAGLVAGARTTAYHVSKFGLVGFTESLRAEYGRRGIGVTALCPGPVQTNLYRSGVSGKKRRAVVPDPPAWISTSPEHVAAAALRAILKNQRFVLLTPLAHVLYNAKRFAPGFLDWMHQIGRRKTRRAAITHEALPLNVPFDANVPSTQTDAPLRRAA
jgi:NAD(P)-dependent dehydrogenase (short-subunit alcohol dehydrogenase family)